MSKQANRQKPSPWLLSAYSGHKGRKYFTLSHSLNFGQKMLSKVELNNSKVALSVAASRVSRRIARGHKEDADDTADAGGTAQNH